ncbi:hypothetical protein [Burkholderia plantarii]|uniref:Phage protein gp65 n=1 Tax=Burkholderia plantarii TaxID=41899 RepID=A0A0B6RYQ6_BURPL|nr:hypothetical protein [Burkholderia plantarii]AJK46205.1 phage protein gp65 [Burkholderia plantarii]
MSAHLYFYMSDVPDAISATAVRRTEARTGRRLISFPGCAVGGVESERGEVEMPLPRAGDVAAWVVNWLMYWGIPFCVLP